MITDGGRARVFQGEMGCGPRCPYLALVTQHPGFIAEVMKDIGMSSVTCIPHLSLSLLSVFW